MTSCQPLPTSVASELLQLVSRALCILPDESPAQGQSRVNQMILTAVGLEPRDGLEYMLSTLVFGHFNLILDSMQDVFHGNGDKAKLKTNIVALDRAMATLLREFRLMRKRPLAAATQDVRQSAPEAQAANESAVPAAREAEPEPAKRPDARPAQVAPKPARVRATTHEEPPANLNRAPPCENANAETEPAFEETLAAIDELLAESRALQAEAKAAAAD